MTEDQTITTFSSKQYPWLHTYLESKPGTVSAYKKEWQWLRYLVNGKQFAAICTPDEKYKDYANRTMIILKTNPDEVELLCSEYEDIVPGFYSDKKHWISVYLDGSIEDVLLKHLCDISYQLVFDKLTKTAQKEILSL